MCIKLLNQITHNFYGGNMRLHFIFLLFLFISVDVFFGHEVHACCILFLRYVYTRMSYTTTYNKWLAGKQCALKTKQKRVHVTGLYHILKVEVFAYTSMTYRLWRKHLNWLDKWELISLSMEIRKLIHFL